MRIESTVGTIKLRRRFSAEALRHPMSGHIPVIMRSMRNRGVFTCAKKGGPTVILLPVASSDMSGKIVPHSVANARARRTTLFKRNVASRERNETPGSRSETAGASSYYQDA